MKVYIFTYLSYDDKKASYKTLKCKRPERPCIHIDDIEQIYDEVMLNVDIYPMPALDQVYQSYRKYCSITLLKEIALEDWYIRLPEKMEEVEEWLSASNIIKLAMLKQYINHLSGRDKNLDNQANKNQTNENLF